MHSCCEEPSTHARIRYGREFSIVKSAGVKYINDQRAIKLDFMCTKSNLNNNTKY